MLQEPISPGWIVMWFRSVGFRGFGFKGLGVLGCLLYLKVHDGI